MTRPRTIRALLLVTSTLGALAVSEVLLRALSPAPGRWRNTNDVPGLYVADSQIGYRLAPNFTGAMKRPDFAIPIVTNDLGMRELPPEPARRERTAVVLAVGDSYTFGWGVPREAAWPARLEARLRSGGRAVRVLNGGVPGYNLRQIRKRASQLVAAVKPDLLVVGVFPEGKSRLLVPFTVVGGAVVDTRVVPRMRQVDGGYLYTRMRHQATQQLDFWLDQHWYVGAYALKAAHAMWTRAAARLRGGAPSSDLPLTPLPRGRDQALAMLLAEVDTLYQEARAHHVRVVVLLTNNQEPDGSFASHQALLNRAIARFCARLGIPAVDPLARLVATAHGAPIYRFPSDGHWPAAAHEIAAAALEGVLSTRPARE